ncbi:GvpL/GvpF family gas vesicle protein [Streptomyces sp. NPDC001595]|uniref:GvpL/GvpF family gas vesicle protein n=1 Tax=Streptomyces sp. NPDC001532 TaxID=3154520 RepID=UPI00332B90D8
MTADATLVCAFAVTRSVPPRTAPLGADPGAAAGHDGGGPLRLLPAGDLWLLVQDVPAAAFDETALAERLNRPDDLERIARAHHRAVEVAARWGSVVPLPLATLYLTEDTAVRAVVRREAELAVLLGRLRGRTEWAVKVHAAGTGATAGSHSGGDSGGVGGRAYLSRVSARRRSRDEERERALAEARDLDRELRRHAVAATRHRPQSEQLTGTDAPQLLNGAYLVDDAERASFLAAVERLAALGRRCGTVEVVASGPWIPYSFARLDEAWQYGDRHREQVQDEDQDQEQEQERERTQAQKQEVGA